VRAQRRHASGGRRRIVTRTLGCDHRPVRASQRVEPFVLEGRLVRLEPLRPEHAHLLADAAAEDRAAYAYTRVPRDRADAQRYVAAALAEREAGTALPFVQVERTTDRVVGTTRYLGLEWWERRHGNGLPDVAEIGATWLAASAQRTGINREAKVLLMAHAFDVWQVQRLWWKTDARNERARRAILALGATFEGVLRAHMPSAADADVPRDSACYSMLPPEWPDARRRLEADVERS
jgi:RimJ/RimL family protein N-acetyltransferase